MELGLGANQSESDEDDGLHCPIHKVYIILGVTFMVFVIIASTLGNILAIAAIYRTPRLHTFYFCFVASLAVSDTLVGLSVVPFDIVYWLAFPVWPLGPVICNLWNTLFFMFLTASTLNLCAISLDRFSAIQFPFKYASIITSGRVKVGIVGLWTYSLVLATVIYIGLKPPPSGEYSFDLNKSFVVYLLVGNTLVPFVGLIFMNMVIWNTARKQMKRIISTSSLEEDAQKTNAYRSLAREMKVARMFMLILLCFMVCWLPYLIVQFLLIVTDLTCSIETADTIVCWLTYIPSAMNPFIYSFKNGQFRAAFWKLTWGILPEKWRSIHNNHVMELNTLGFTESHL